MVFAGQRHGLGAVGPFTDDSHAAGEPQPGLHQEAHLGGVVDDHDRRYPHLHGKKVPDPAPAIRCGVGGYASLDSRSRRSSESRASAPAYVSRSSRPRSTSSASFFSAFSMLRVSRGGSCTVFSAGRPAWSSRPRSSSASSSAPKSNAMLVSHSQRRNTITPAREPYVLL